MYSRSVKSKFYCVIIFVIGQVPLDAVVMVWHSLVRWNAVMWPSITVDSHCQNACLSETHLTSRACGLLCYHCDFLVQELFKKFPIMDPIQQDITKSHHWILSWAISIELTSPYPIFQYFFLTALNGITKGYHKSFLRHSGQLLYSLFDLDNNNIYFNCVICRCFKK